MLKIFIALFVLSFSIPAWATTYFVKTTGNDNNAGTTWALAKATVQGCMNLCTVAGDRCVVAAGTYYETGITPGGPGARGTLSELYGDMDNTVADGGANYSGVAGYIKLDASLQSGNKGIGTAANTAASNNWVYWNITNIWFAGGQGLFMRPASGAGTSDGTTYSKCIFEAPAGGNRWDGFTVDSDSYSPHTFDRCIFQSGYRDANGYNSSMITSAQKSTAFTTNPQVVFKNSIFVGPNNLIGSNGGVTEYTYISIQNCTLYSVVNSGTLESYGFYGANSLYYKANITDSIIVAKTGLSLLTTINTNTNNTTYFLASSTASSSPLLPPIPLMFPGSTVIDTLSTGLATDIWGNARSGSTREPGAQEYQAGDYPIEPNMIVPTPGGTTYSSIGFVVN